MFEKEAEEKGFGIGCTVNPTIAFQKGAEFGYNKANEWHFVSKEGFPNKDDIYLIIRSDGLHLGDYCCGGDGDIDCQRRNTTTSTARKLTEKPAHAIEQNAG